MGGPTMGLRPSTGWWRGRRAVERQGDERGQVTGPRASAELMRRLLWVLDLDRAGGPEPSYPDLCRGCAACRHKSRCEHDLTSGRSERCYQAYCPSAHTLGTLRALERARKRLVPD